MNVLHGAQVCLELPLIPVGNAAAFLGEVPNKRFLQSLILPQGLSRKRGEVYDFHAVILQDLSKSVVLCLSAF